MKTKKKINVNIVVRNVVVLIVFIAVLVLVICVPNSGEFSPDVNKSRYRSEKNADELKAIYEKSENKERFAEDVNKVQNAVSMYLLNSGITSDESMETEINKMNEKLEKGDSKFLEIDLPSFWVGTWSVDMSGTVKFKFLNSGSIPSWASDEEISKNIIK